MVIFRADGTLDREPETPCDHGVTFDVEEAERMLGDWPPGTGVEFLMGNPAAAEIRKRWPRLGGPCPLGCGYSGIYYASKDHYKMGDW